MRTYTFLFVLFLSTICVGAQTVPALRGRVTQNGVPVGGATVSLTYNDPTGNKTVNAVTDADGFYKFDDLPVGSHMVIAEGERGKGIAYRGGVEIVAGSTTVLYLVVTMDDYKLFESSIQIKESVSISADTSQPLDEVAKTVNVISAREMRERADITLADSLRTIPGFRVQQLGGFGRTASIKTRGLRNQDTAVLLDGVRLRDASSITGDASAFLGDITLTSVSKVEVLRGSGSSLYGTNAIGGTVDLQSAKIQRGPHGQVSYAAGGLGLQRFRGNITDATSGGIGFNLAIARTAFTKGIDGNDNANNTNAQGRVQYGIGFDTQFVARFFISDAYVRLNSDPDTLGTLPPTNFGIITARPGVNFLADTDDPDNTQRSSFFNGQLTFAHSFSDKAVLKAYYSGLNTSRKNDNGVLGVGFQSASTSAYNGLIQTVNATLDLRANSANQVKIGYEFELEKFGNDGFTADGAGNFSARATQFSNTIFVQDLVSFLDGNLQFAGGFRAQFYSLGDPRFSLQNAPYSNVSTEAPPAAYTFDGAASYYISRTGTKLRAHVGNGYRVPSLYERFGTFFSSWGSPSFIALGDPQLKPERTIAFDGGIEQTLFAEKAKLSATYFYTRLIDTIGYGNVVPNIGTTPRPFGGYINQKGGIARGGEFSARVHPTSNTDIFASYTLTNSDQRMPQIAGSGVTSTLGVPDHQFTLVATHRFKRSWVTFDLLATSSYLAPVFSNSSFNSYVYRFGGNRRGDLTAGHTFKLGNDQFDLRLFGTLENVFDHEYYENGFRTAGRSVRAGVSFGF